MAKRKGPKPGKLTEFQGTIVESARGALHTASGVRGARQVWFPKSRADVAAAVARTKDQLTLIRSGIQTAASDVAEAVGGIVINLAALSDVSVKAGVVTAEAAATTRDVAEIL